MAQGRVREAAEVLTLGGSPLVVYACLMAKESKEETTTIDEIVEKTVSLKTPNIVDERKVEPKPKPKPKPTVSPLCFAKYCQKYGVFEVKPFDGDGRCLACVGHLYGAIVKYDGPVIVTKV